LTTQSLSIELDRALDSQRRYAVWEKLFFPKYVFRYLLFKLGLSSKWFKAKLFFGEKVWVPVPSAQDDMWVYGGLLDDHEVRYTRYLFKQDLEGKVFYDVGANTGYYSALVKRLGAEVVAFEPQPEVFSKLERVSGITPVQLALGEKEEMAPLFIPETLGMNGSSSLDADWNPTEEIKMVGVTTLNGIVKGLPRPDFIKLDVEGYEFQVLKGGEEFLVKDKPGVAIEVSGGFVGASANTDPHANLRKSLKTVDYMMGLGYVPYRITAAGEKVRIPKLLEYLKNEVDGSDMLVLEAGNALS
jgi:FkbM family methyltransferase